VLELAAKFEREGEPEFHGFLAAQALTEFGFQARLAATGTIYTTLDRLRRGGFLESRWEDAFVSEAEGRPRRKLYRMAPAGRSALAEATRQQLAPGGRAGFAGAPR
jgi:DNA-binding PadR family transcriptional regulator